MQPHTNTALCKFLHAKNNSAIKNQRATQLLRGADVFGDALILQHTTEHGRITPRMCSYTLAEYDHVFADQRYLLGAIVVLQPNHVVEQHPARRLLALGAVIAVAAAVAHAIPAEQLPNVL